MGFLKRKRRSRLGNATLVTREWTPERGLVEHEARLASFTDLLESCLDRGAPMPERIVLTGTDRDGRELSISFSFASSATRSR